MESHALIEIRDAVRHPELRIDARVEGVDRRFEAVDRRFESLEGTLSSHFTWLVGIQVTTLIAIVAALLARP
jgi:hypothetical protein